MRHLLVMLLAFPLLMLGQTEEKKFNLKKEVKKIPNIDEALKFAEKLNA